MMISPVTERMLLWQNRVYTILRASTRPKGEYPGHMLSLEETNLMREKYSLLWKADDFAKLIQAKDAARALAGAVNGA